MTEHSPGPQRRSGRARAGVPVTVSLAAALAGLEALGILVYAGLYTAQVLPLGEDPMTRALIAGGVVLFLVLAAAAVGAAAWSLLALRHWPRSLLVVVQLIAIATLLPLAVDGSPAAWAPVGVAAAVVVLVLAPPTTAAIERRPASSDPGGDAGG